MEENKTTKLNNVAADLPEVPRDEAGQIDLDAISLGKNEKGNYIFPDEIIENYFKELPDGSTNKDNNKWVYSGGILRKATQEVWNKGGEALRAKVEQRKSLRETAEVLLQLKGDKESIEELGLPEGTDAQTVIIWRAINDLQKRSDPNMYKAIEATLGEQPTAKINAEVLNVTPEDQELMKRVAARLDKN